VFTGIIEELGRIHAAEYHADAIRLTFAATDVLVGTAPGDSIAVDGCCLTVTELTATTWTADVMASTLAATTLGRRRAGDPVNLERAVVASQRLGGHIVQGHIDGVGVITAREASERWDVVEIALPPDEALDRYLVDKGSIAVDGVSLTVVRADAGSFTVSLIPETLARTTLGRRRVGEEVNLEVDVLAKHVEKLLAWRSAAVVS
jgi:riboflavin synthase